MGRWKDNQRVLRGWNAQMQKWLKVQFRNWISAPFLVLIPYTPSSLSQVAKTTVGLMVLLILRKEIRENAGKHSPKSEPGATIDGVPYNTFVKLCQELDGVGEDDMDPIFGLPGLALDHDGNVKVDWGSSPHGPISGSQKRWGMMIVMVARIIINNDNGKNTRDR